MYKYLIYFLIFSFFGWCTEVIFHIIKTGKIVNRGLCKGPICPIYGVGICLSSLLLSSVKSFILLSTLSMAIATIVEFFVGLFVDKVLKRKLWDYTEEKGNILGYVCPRFSLIWGVVCASVIRILPLLDPFVEFMSTPFGYALAFILSIIALLDIKAETLKKNISNEAKIKRITR